MSAARALALALSLAPALLGAAPLTGTAAVATPAAAPSPAPAATPAPDPERLEAIRAWEPVDLGPLQDLAPGLQAIRLSFFSPQAGLSAPPAPARTLIIGGRRSTVVLRDDAATVDWLSALTHTVSTRAQADAMVDAFVALRGYVVAANSPCQKSDTELDLPMGVWQRHALQWSGGWTVELPLVVDPFTSASVRYTFNLRVDGRMELKSTRKLCANGGYDG